MAVLDRIETLHSLYSDHRNSLFLESHEKAKSALRWTERLCRGYSAGRLAVGLDMVVDGCVTHQDYNLGQAVLPRYSLKWF